MSVNNGEEETPTSRKADELESPRKRIRLGNSSLKRWSLMDTKTDEKVLHEMGVSLLEPDDHEHCELAFTSTGSHHKTLKRKQNIENVNPNVISSPRARRSPKSPRTRARASPCSPTPGPSKLPYNELNSSFSEECLHEEETPLRQYVAEKYCGKTHGARASVTGGKERRNSCNSVTQEEEIVYNVAESPADGDSFASLSAEMMLSIFRWLPKVTLAQVMLVCKRWYRIACDETLWQRLDLGNKTLTKNALGRILARNPTIVRLANSEIGEWRPAGASAAARVQYLDLSVSAVGVRTLDHLLARCPALKKLSLESVNIATTTCFLIGKCKNLETLNLTMAQGITAEGLTAILEGCQNLVSLNISWCELSAAALQSLVASLPPRLQRLNAAGARGLTDDMVGQLVARCPRLLELDLSDCSQLKEEALLRIQTLSRLEHLALSRCYLLPPQALTKLSCMPALQFAELWGLLPARSLAALRAALPAVLVNQFMFSAIARPTVGAKRTSIWGLRTRD
ncbi:S-phase kinase-associated protein 2-like isoform X2 [Plodia interpunctella]|uniref:S-phase kinase-associated protein 2-like isoform X2 n=1 Tax=Plodia interpunctella TaxID=58824 RepID=UPI0023677E49|nr:S-phase kinase-associated protein 2-like isoform X2 [Plodia interpunctella]